MATTYDKISKGFVVDGKTIGIEAAKVEWDAIKDFAVTSESTATEGIMTPDQIHNLVNAHIATVYKAKGTITAEVDEDSTITNMPTDSENGDVWNIALPSGTSSAFIGDETVTDGDNVVYIVSGESGKWDKLAGVIDTTVFATKTWVDEESGVATKIAAAVDDADDMVEAKADELVKVGAVVGYVDAKMDAAYSFGAVAVGDDTIESTEPGDTVTLASGDGVTVAIDTDEEGNKSVKISSNIDISGKAGSAADAADLDVEQSAEGGVAKISIVVPDATTEKAGVTKAAYFDEDTEFIHLF